MYSTHPRIWKKITRVVFCIPHFMLHHPVAGREAHGNLWLLTYYSSLSKMLRKGGLLSLKEGQLREWFQESIRVASIFLQVFDLTDGPCLNFLVICHFISCQVFNFCLLEVTPLWTSPRSNWICHRNRTLENFIFFFPAWRQARRQGRDTQSCWAAPCCCAFTGSGSPPLPHAFTKAHSHSAPKAGIQSHKKGLLSNHLRVHQPVTL